MLTLSSKQSVVFKSLGRLGVLLEFEKQVSQRCGSLVKATSSSKSEPLTLKNPTSKMAPINLKVTQKPKNFNGLRNSFDDHLSAWRSAKSSSTLTCSRPCSSTQGTSLSGWLRRLAPTWKKFAWISTISDKTSSTYLSPSFKSTRTPLRTNYS